jgi:uridine phosphorylase
VPAATFPNFAGKHTHEAMFSPADFVAYLRRMGILADYQPPAGVVLCYQRSLYEQVLAAEGVGAPAHSGGLLAVVRLPSTAGRIGLLGRFGIGAPGAVVALEELAATGTTAFVSIGTAGSLQRDVNVGDLVLCRDAIRDEGVSHHYLAPAKLAVASPPMTSALAAELRKAGAAFREGTSWTIDTPYRETVAEARQYQSDGVLCVEMEAAALFAVAQVRQLRVASAFVVSDSLADLVWSPQFHSPTVDEGLMTLFRAAVAALLDAPADDAGSQAEPDAAA